MERWQTLRNGDAELVQEFEKMPCSMDATCIKVEGVWNYLYRDMEGKSPTF